MTSMTDQLAVSFECRPVCSRRFQPDGETPPSRAVIEAVAEAEGVDPIALPPLHESIDPDGLNRLFQCSDHESRAPQVLCFTFDGWNVFVRGDGTILVADSTQQIGPIPLFPEATDEREKRSPGS